MSLVNYQIFYRKSGIRTLGQVINPNLQEVSDLVLPLDSVYHYCDFDGFGAGPSNDDILFKGNSKTILVHHVLELSNDLGFPRKTAVNYTTDIRDYHNTNRRTRLLKNTDNALRDHSTLVVYNYSLINKSYKYVRSFYTEYYKWYNEFSTIINTISGITHTSNRQHFITCNIPRIIPSIQQLNLATVSMTQSLLKVIRDKNSFILLELWKWMNPDPEIKLSSIFNKLDKSKLHLLNVVYIEDTKYTVLNLGVLNSFNANTPDSDEVIVKSAQKLPFAQLQKRLLRLMITIMEVRTATAAKANDVNVSDLDTEDKIAEAKLIEDLNIDTDLINTQDLDAVQNTEEPLTQEQKDEISRLEDIKLDEELAQLNEIAKRQEFESNDPKVTLRQLLSTDDATPLENGIMSICNKLADDGLLSAPEFKRFTAISTAYKSIVAPNGQLLHEYAKIEPKDLLIEESGSIVDRNTVLDKTMLKSSLLQFDSNYIKNVLPKDTFNMVLSMHNAGIAVTDYKVENITDILGSYDIHSVKLNPVVGRSGTIRFKLPVVKEDGTYTSNGVVYRLRKQRSDLPIRKIDSDRVALTSYYGKTFVTRSRKKANDYGHWLVSQIMLIGLDRENTNITELRSADVFEMTARVPRAYSAISDQIKSFICKGYELSFDYNLRNSLYGSIEIAQLEKHGMVVIGKSLSMPDYLLMDNNNTIYTSRDNKINVLGTIEEFLSIDNSSAPVEYTEIGIFGKDIPVGVVLSFYIGFEKLLKILNVEPRRVPAHSRLNLSSDEWMLAFSDETLVFSREDRLASLILSGFNAYHKTIKLFSVYSFDKKGVYLNLLEANGLSVRYIREIELFQKMFIDPITRDILIEMKEPITVRGLLLRASELLLIDAHPEQLDPKYMRIRGYERLSGTVYTNLIQAIRYHDGRLGKSNYPIEINPSVIWRAISEDPSKSLVNQINPIESLKEIESVTYSGSGGRAKRSMTKSTRGYHVNDMGTISESTVDSSDVSINVFTSADPQFRSLRGMSKPYVIGKTGATALMSTTSLMLPASDRDDAKRTNYSAIQASHAIACDGYHQYSVRTGYDSVIADRTGDMFAITAKKPGLVISIETKGIVVKYTDDTTQGFELGRRFGAAAGLTIPHEIVTPLKVGDTFELGDPIIYNSGFFEPDFFNKKRITLKNSINVKTVLWESSQTLEDACSISVRAASRLSTRTTKVKNIIVSFDQSVSKLVKVGDSLNADDTLCIVEDAVTANNSLFNSASIDTLRLLSAQTPRSGVKGIVERIEVYYHGDKEDMSVSLKTISDISDKILKSNSSSYAANYYPGSVDGSFRIDNEQLSLDSLAIRIYITSDVSASIGD